MNVYELFLENFSLFSFYVLHISIDYGDNYLRLWRLLKDDRDLLTNEMIVSIFFSAFLMIHKTKIDFHRPNSIKKNC